MKVKEFHLMVTEAIEKQVELADLDAVKDSPAKAWHMKALAIQKKPWWKFW